MRCFISIDLSEEVKEKVVFIQKELEKKGLFTGKFTEKKNLHLTLKFLGEIDEDMIKNIDEKLKTINPQKFVATIDCIGVFSPKFIRIIWLHISNIDKLQKKVDESLHGLFRPEKRFMSHLTIARPKIISDKNAFLNIIDNISIDPISFEVKSFKLKKSVLNRGGPVYTTLKEYTERPDSYKEPDLRS